MTRLLSGSLLLLALSGCINFDSSAPETGGIRPSYGRSAPPPMVPGVKGPNGEGVPMSGPYRPASEADARRMMSNNIPGNMIQFNPGGMTPPGMPPTPGMGGLPGMMGGMPSMGGPPGMMGGMPNMGSPPGMMGGMPNMMSPRPGMGGPPMGPMPTMGGGPSLLQTGFSAPPNASVMHANVPPGGPTQAGLAQAQFANSSPIGSMFPAQRTQIFFSKPAGMKIFWVSQGPDGKAKTSVDPLETPGRYNFAQASIYRLMLTHIPGRPALQLFPTLEVVPTSPKTNEFLAHNAVPLEFTEDDFKQVVDRNYIVKVVYLPDPQFQEGAGVGPDEIVSTRLNPGEDPIQEALRRGTILLVLRIGNIDQGLQHSPGMSAPGPNGGGVQGQIPGGGQGKPPMFGVPPLFQVPQNTTPIAPGIGTNPNGGGFTPPKANLPPLGGVPGIVPEIPGLFDKNKGGANDQKLKPVVPPLPNAPDATLPLPTLPVPRVLPKDPINIEPKLPLVPMIPDRKEPVVIEPKLPALPIVPDRKDPVKIEPKLPLVPMIPARKDPVIIEPKLPALPTIPDRKDPVKIEPKLPTLPILPERKDSVIIEPKLPGLPIVPPIITPRVPTVPDVNIPVVPMVPMENNGPGVTPPKTPALPPLPGEFEGVGAGILKNAPLIALPPLVPPDASSLERSELPPIPMVPLSPGKR